MIEEDSSSSSSSCSQAETSESEEKASGSRGTRRDHHNMLEKKRRDNIKQSFTQLKDILPNFSEKKRKRVPRIEILQKTCDFIKENQKYVKKEKKVSRLKEENQIMERSIANMEEAIEKNDLEAMANILSQGFPIKRMANWLENEDDSSEEDSEDTETSDEDSSEEDDDYSYDDVLEDGQPVASCSKRIRRC